MNYLNRYIDVQREIKDTLKVIGREEEIRLLIVTKGEEVDKCFTLYERYKCELAENRWQEASLKIFALPKSCNWHFIGTLQLNKVVPVVTHFSCIHSVDSLLLLKKIAAVAENLQKVMPIFLQVNTSGEKSKHGLLPDQWEEILPHLESYPYVQIIGLMTMGPTIYQEKTTRACFRQLFSLRQQWAHFFDPKAFCHLSMGMSRDYKIALEEGATYLRLGSLIFKGNF